MPIPVDSWQLPGGEVWELVDSTARAEAEAAKKAAAAALPKASFVWDPVTATLAITLPTE